MRYKRTRSRLARRLRHRGRRSRRISRRRRLVRGGLYF